MTTKTLTAAYLLSAVSYDGPFEPVNGNYDLGAVEAVESAARSLGWRVLPHPCGGSVRDWLPRGRKAVRGIDGLCRAFCRAERLCPAGK
jgi:hypothetical protein